ncbi:response regulator transcription factor [Saccharibacillus alkalitolerans]|uniref:Response regulator n=1 Tax=Saccharibacillus alkalitolerans TaxID=2705290 RepID=A0ABX0FB46_9BACL|nr:response regulator [Saccharibacillus alkalitolerans]NGZ77590.1 response regulator [Saccharibacillus alkalitolerans]
MREEPYRVLIADDEPIIREGLREAVNWEELGMEVAGEAEDGEEALELALSLRVHLVLVDMNMPFLNGISVMRKLRERLPDCRFVIITGHDEFDYAREGIRLGVEDYILKPVNPELLRGVVLRVKESLDSEAKQAGYLKLASEQIRRNIPLLKARFGQEWAEGLLNGEEIEERLKFLGLPAASPVQLCVIRWPEPEAAQPVMRESDRQLYLFAAENIVSELAGERRHMLIRDSGGLLLLFLWDAAEAEIAAHIERSVRRFLKITVQAHIESVTSGTESLPNVYKRCREAVYKDAQLSPLVRRAREYIRDYYGDPDLTLESFARDLQVSPVYLSRVLKKELGDSFVALVTHARIRKAIELLNTTDLPIYEIAEQSGYDSQHYFSTAFKKVMGVSPNQYRRGAAFPDQPSGR